MKTKKHKIFIVDDNKIFADTLERHLYNNTKYPIEIFKYTTGEECIKNFKLSPEIIILDYYFDSSSYSETMNGIEILKKIRIYDESIKVIMLSSQDKIEIAIETMKYNSFDYVVKNDSAFIKTQINVNVIIDNIMMNKKMKKLETGIYILSLFMLLAIITSLILFYN